MKIKQVFNNNVVLSENKMGEEVILVGRGIAFGLTKGNSVREEKIEKKFELQEDVGQKFKSLIQDIPYDYILASEQIIDYIKSQSKNKINDSIYVTLTDHVSNLVERVKMGIVFDSALLLNVKALYKEEYKLGLQATEILRKKLKIEISDSEASFIALHIINAEIGIDMQHTYVITRAMDDILNIVKQEFSINKMDDILYDRFLTHCRFFLQRVVNKEYLTSKETDNFNAYQVLEQTYPKQKDCIQRICDFIRSKYTYKVSLDERLYLMLHLIKVTD